jgi:arylsulfatase
VTRPPNIVWIFPDEWRHDALGYRGNSVIRTPHLDALAARGRTLPEVVCESPVCQPSRASLLTCRTPRRHGLTQNNRHPVPDAEVEARLSRLMPAGEFPGPDADNILHRLQAAGYLTSEVGKMHFINRLHSDAELRAYGFDEVSEEYDKVVLRLPVVETPYTRHLDELGLLAAWREHEDEQTEILMGRDPSGRRALPDAVPAEHTLDAHIGGRVVERIERYAQDDRPFFLWAGFVGPHVPFDGPPPYADLYDPATLPMGPLGFDGYTDNVWGAYLRYVVDLLNCAQYTEADYRLMAKHYYASISLIDDQIGRIVAAVDAAGIADNTWFVFSSDHGEMLGDHGLVTKGVFYDASVRVPGLVVPPRGAAPVAVATRCQGIDLPATMLALAGADTDGLDGRSVLGAVGSAGREALVSEVGAFTMVATADYKLIAETATAEPQALYHLASDADERQDVLGDLAHRSGLDTLHDRHLLPYLASSTVLTGSSS